MPIALLFALLLAQAEPAGTPPTPSSPEDMTAAGASNLPKDDYGLVAWCHGALAGQLELDPIAHADMVAIEGKAKVAARAKSDAEMEKDRREYLREYERALSAAEKASPTAIHDYGVESEVSGYKLWAVTRQKQPIWRMLDWGMWDPNDAGCGEAAKRLYNKSSLFSEALKGSGEEKTSDAKAAPTSASSFATAHEASAPAAAGPEAPSPTVDTPAAAPAQAAGPDTPVADAAPAPKVDGGKAKTAKARTVKVAAKRKPNTRVEPVVATPEPVAPVPDSAPGTVAAPAAAPEEKPAPPADTPLRGPQA